MAAMSILRIAICEERWGKKGLRYRSKGVGAALKYSWVIREVTTLKLRELG